MGHLLREAAMRPVTGRARNGFATLLWLTLTTFALPVAAATPLVGRVTHVADGDTFTMLVHGHRYRVRLQEIDAPEHGQPWGDEARRALADKVDGKYVRVDVSGTDEYGRALGIVWLGNHDINRELVREGDAWAYRHYLKDDSLLAIEAAARQAKRGLWRSADPMPPWQWRHSGRGQPHRRVRTGHPRGCDVKGNINRRGEHIYHQPGDPDYAATRIDTARGERWFCSPRDAELAGWRAPR